MIAASSSRSSVGPGQPRMPAGPRELIAARGAGQLYGRDGALLPGPGHSGRDRSLWVTFDSAHPRGYRFKSFADDPDRSCLDYLDGLIGLSFEPGRRRAEAPQARPVPTAGPDQNVERRKQLALEIWRAGTPLRGTEGERRLNARGLDLPGEIDGTVLRYHPRTPWRNADGIQHVPAMLGLFRNVRTDEPQAVHRTRLDQKGRMSLGPISGAAIKLDADAEVTLGLTVGEGIETCLAARQMGLRPVWAMGCAGGIGSLEPLPGIEGLTLLAETDDAGANERACLRCAAKWQAVGADVILIEPEIRGDLNDVLMAGAHL